MVNNSTIIHHICSKFPSAYMQANNIIIPHIINSAQGRSKQVQFEVSLPYNFPQGKPTIIMKTQGALEKDHRYINRRMGNRIEHPKLENWAPSNDLAMTLVEIVGAVEKEPLYFTQDNQQSQQQQQPPQFGNQPPQFGANSFYNGNNNVHHQHVPYQTQQQPQQQPPQNLYQTYHSNTSYQEQQLKQQYGQYQHQQSQQQQPSSLSQTQNGDNTFDLTTLNQSTLEKLSDAQLRTLLENQSKIRDYAEKDNTVQMKKAQYKKLEEENQKLAYTKIEKDNEVRKNVEKFNEEVKAYNDMEREYSSLLEERQRLLKETNDPEKMAALMEQARDKAKTASNRLKPNGNDEQALKKYVDEYLAARTLYHLRDFKLLEIKKQQQQQQHPQQGRPHYYQPQQRSAYGRSSLPAPANDNTTNNPMFYTPQY